MELLFSELPKDRYLLNIDRCRRNWAAATPVKYERDVINVILFDFINREISITRKFMNEVLVTTYNYART